MSLRSWPTDSQRSPSSSPARKRQRLSSPTYDEQLDDVSQEDIAAFDEIEYRLSQQPQQSPRGSQPIYTSQEAKERRARAIAEALRREENDLENDPSSSLDGINVLDQVESSSRVPLVQFQDDPDNPFNASPNSTEFSFAQNATKIHSDSGSGLKSAFKLASNVLPNLMHTSHSRSPSPEIPPETDYSTWFQPEQALPTTLPPVGFQTAKFASASSIPIAGFMKASNKGWIAPSVAALAKAEEKMKQIWQEGDTDQRLQPTDENLQSTSVPAPALASSAQSPHRPVFRVVQNSKSYTSPGTPTPAPGFVRPSISSPSGINFLKEKGNAKSFKSPLINSTINATPNTGSPLNPSHLRHVSASFTTAGSQHPFTSTSIAIAATPLRSAAAFTTPVRSTAFTTPVRSLGLVPRGGAGTMRNSITPGPSRFVTPFKVGMAPGEPGRNQLEEREKPALPVHTPALSKPHEGWLTKERQFDPLFDADKRRSRYFNLEKPPHRKILATSGLVPQSYSNGDLESLGINGSELSQITPELAKYYSFHIPATSSTPALPLTDNIRVLGPADALDELLDRGCWLASKPWVDNHWCLILWKLAGMVFLDPDRETGEEMDKRWSWNEVMRQLLYRYERELNGGTRPPLRQIATQDAPASCPMVLCVSNITWSPAGLTDDGMPIESHPELEVTDGWYRIRAQVDAPLARAIRKGVIRVGRKIAVAGARLSSERKDPMEILEAYNSIKLVLSGNSSHMAPWHAKMGFQLGPFISTFHSLTPDGGNVAVMDIVVTKTYPVAFLEFIETEDGQKHREGPRSENEEAKVQEKWKKRREVEESKLRSELEKKLNRYEGYVERLERRAGNRFNPGVDDDGPPDQIESLFEQLEDPREALETLSRVTSNEAGWLARYIRDRAEKDRESIGEEISQELAILCPPREVRNFRVIIVQDACTRRRPANREAQLTVWDVLNLSLSEGSTAGAFEVGHRFLVTNLMPTQKSAWMDCEPGSEVYLSTRRDSRWTKMKSPV